MHDLHVLPKVRDSWTYLYVERCRVDQDGKAIACHDVNGKTPVPCATLTLLMLGPGTTITHAAIRTLAEHGCSVLWVGEGGVRCYAQGLGETRSALNLLRQARAWGNPQARLRVVRRMYEVRFPQPLDPHLTLQQIRGYEGVRMREMYARWSRETGAEWAGRSYRRDEWVASDPVNRALSAANSCLYGVCHAAIISAGYSPALGFVHTGKQLSFVYDIADLYKAEITIPAAFTAAQEGMDGLEGRVRRTCRDYFHAQRLLAKIVDDIEHVLAAGHPMSGDGDDPYADDEALPGGLWDPTVGIVPGGRNHAEEEGMDE